MAESENEKDQRIIGKDQTVSGKHQRTFLFSLSLTLSVNGLLALNKTLRESETQKRQWWYVKMY